MKKIKPIKAITPIGTFKFAWLNKADTKFNPAGEYKTDLMVDESLMEDLIEKAENLRDTFFDAKVAELKEAGKGATAKKVTKLAVFAEDEDPETGEPTGKIRVRAKLKAHVEMPGGTSFTQKPELKDAKGNPLPVEVKIFSGSTGRLGLEIVPYFSAKDKQVGISCRLKVAQVKEIKQSSSFDMGAMEGGQSFGDSGDFGEMTDAPTDDSASDGDAGGGFY